MSAFTLAVLEANIEVAKRSRISRAEPRERDGKRSMIVTKIVIAGLVPAIHGWSLP